ncbi:MAG: peptidylprolyl isomerase [Candidatus Thermoplasmatota archaeon]|nr:peptidylprolyl isomerase [Candidatus Thermoplasmatota archaeon]
MANPTAVMETEKGTMTIELFADATPKTVENFVKLAKDGFYDGLRFHRVIDDFVVQAGCPHSKKKGSKRAGTGGPGYSIKCETDAPKQVHKRGSLSMAHRGKDTGGSQFFICHSPQPHLDKKHTVFGQVVENVDVVDKIQVWDEIKSLAIKD